MGLSSFEKLPEIKVVENPDGSTTATSMTTGFPEESGVEIVDLNTIVKILERIEKKLDSIILQRDLAKARINELDHRITLTHIKIKKMEAGER